MFLSVALCLRGKSPFFIILSRVSCRNHAIPPFLDIPPTTDYIFFIEWTPLGRHKVTPEGMPSAEDTKNHEERFYYEIPSTLCETWGLCALALRFAITITYLCL